MKKKNNSWIKIKDKELMSNTTDFLHDFTQYSEVFICVAIYYDNAQLYKFPFLIPTAPLDSIASITQASGAAIPESRYVNGDFYNNSPNIPSYVEIIFNSKHFQLGTLSIKNGVTSSSAYVWIYGKR